MGGGSQSQAKPVKLAKADNTQRTSEFQMWQQALEAQQNMQREAIAAQERMAQQQREAQAAETARQAALAQAEIDKANAAEAKKKADEAAQNAGQQATGAVASSASNLNLAKLAAQKTAPGLSPYASALDEASKVASKVGNAFFSPTETKFGGN
jgi:regulator of protease activity HflC (stomatin/prohibitin superfamily)